MGRYKLVDPQPPEEQSLEYPEEMAKFYQKNSSFPCNYLVILEKIDKNLSIFSF